MQAIESYVIPGTLTKPTRIKAVCARGSITMSYPDVQTNEEAHKAVVSALVTSFSVEDNKRHFIALGSNTWLAKRSVGQLKNGRYVHVYV